jgi:hypothetical protein
MATGRKVSAKTDKPIFWFKDFTILMQKRLKDDLGQTPFR